MDALTLKWSWILSMYPVYISPVSHHVFIYQTIYLNFKLGLDYSLRTHTALLGQSIMFQTPPFLHTYSVLFW